MLQGSYQHCLLGSSAAAANRWIDMIVVLDTDDDNTGMSDWWSYRRIRLL